jgi:hypothetical protein
MPGIPLCSDGRDGEVIKAAVSDRVEDIHHGKQRLCELLMCKPFSANERVICL